ncbi:MAG: hypothetical protein EP343_31245 [Deltaproteobacteria bacterium]|nr:MAG: hypothetical protein EP343_31245 [Deltaproteobacteria bacterium]
MKIRKSSIRSTSVKETSSAKVDATEANEPLEAIDNVDQADRFEVGGSAPEYEEREEEPEELEELLEESLEDPVMFQEVARSALLGMEELPPSVDTTWNGVATLLDPDRD